MVEEVRQENTAEQAEPQVVAEPSTEVEVEQAVEAPVPPVEAPDPLGMVQDFLGREQGRLAQVSGQRIAAVEKAFDAKLDSLMQSIQPLIEQANAAKKEQLLNMGQEELAEMVLEQQRGNATAQQTPQQDPYLTALATASQELITENNLNVPVDSPDIWQGWQQGMSVTKSLEIAKQNIERMAGKTAAPTQVAPAAQQASAQETPQVAPSTQGAPQKSNKTISSRSELAEMFAAGRISSEQYRKGKQDLRNSGTVSF
jgi:hypothetical protein